MHLNRELIVSAAMGLLDEFGLADTTMRRVASRLNAAPGALYWHIANKQALIAAMADRIIAPVSGNSVEELALSLRQCLLDHRDGAEVTAAGLSQPGNPAWEKVVSDLAHQITQHHVDVDRARVGARAIAHLVLGATTMEQSAAQLISADAHSPTSEAACPLKEGEKELRLGIEIILQGLKNPHPTP